MRLQARIVRLVEPRGEAQPSRGAGERRRRRWPWLVAAWLVAVGVTLAALTSYSFEAGRPAVAPARWPEGTVIERDEAGFTLVMVVHPRCSCSRASLAELARLLVRLPRGLRATVLFVKPDGVDEDWEKTDLLGMARDIAGVEVVVDAGGREASRFGGKTSGQVYLYGRDGALLFAGGITPTRAHEGDNVGSRRVVQLVTTGEADRRDSAVYGCPIEDEAAADFILRELR